MGPVAAGALASLATGLVTVVGALPILAMARPTEAQQNMMLGFAAGVMLAASFFSLIIPGIAQAERLGAGRVEASATIIAAVLLGGGLLAWVNQAVPSFERFGLGPSGIAAVRFRRIWLFILAITLHNFPEGMAVGVSFGAPDMSAGITTALGIGLQNLPEGLAVAAAMLTLGYSRLTGVGVALLSGLAEPIAGLAGAWAVTFSEVALPWGLGLAAGAMIYTVASEIIPDNHTRLHGQRATAGLMVGLAAMMFLDITLG